MGNRLQVAGTERTGAICGDFVEMEDHGAMNWCCGGGGGVSSNERAHELKLTAFNKKKSQVELTGAVGLVTACSNCRTNLEEGVEANEMGVEVLGLTEMIAAHLADKPAAQKS